MNSKNEITRITIDMPKLEHKKLKALAAITGKSMREMVLEFIDSGLSQYQKAEACPYSHKPNKETIEAIKRSKKKENAIKAKSVDDFFKKLGM